MRRTSTVKIPPDAKVLDKPSRDAGKCFFITEMPSAKTERWARRAIMALVKSGMEIPDEVAQSGMAGVAAMGFQAFAGIEDEVAEQLLQEMLECVQIIPDAANPGVIRALMTDDDIEEVATRVMLRMEVFALHTGFSMADLRSRLSSAMTTKTA